MIIIGILFSFAGIGFLCWLLFTLAVYALPFLAGLTAGLATLHAGGGPIGAIVVGIAAATCVLVIGQVLFALAPSPLIRALTALVFAAPAAFAGYEVVHGLTALAAPPEDWPAALAIIGALAVGATAWVRMTIFRPSLPVRDVAVPTAPVLPMPPVSNDG